MLQEASPIAIGHHHNSLASLGPGTKEGFEPFVGATMGCAIMSCSVPDKSRTS